MQRYYLLLDPATLEVYVSQPLASAPENSVLVDQNQQYNFARAKFDQYPNPTTVVEGMPSEEIDVAKTTAYMQKLQDTAYDLRIRAKAAAIDKVGSSQYIVSQQELYELKFKVASGQIVNAYMSSLLANEASEFGLPVEDFCTLIVHKYNTAKEKYEVFLLMIERCRTKIHTLIENKSWLAADAAFANVATLQNQEQAQGIMDQILAL